MTDQIQKWEVWSEGYRATCEAGGAMHHGTVEAQTFREACDKIFGDDELYDRIQLTYWGCRLFDNLESAMKSFG